MRTLKQIADYQILTGSFCPDLSLFNGKTGIAVFFFLYARYTGNNRYSDFAGELLDDVCNHLYTGLPVTFADGLCGIGWGIEFLKKQCFIEGDTDEILAEVDKAIMERDVRRISDLSVETGMKGILFYVKSRFDSSSEKNRTLFDLNYLNDLDGVCKRIGWDWCSDEFSMDVAWAYMKEVFSFCPVGEKDGWKKGLTLIKAE